MIRRAVGWYIGDVGIETEIAKCALDTATLDELIELHLWISMSQLGIVRHSQQSHSQHLALDGLHCVACVRLSQLQFVLQCLRHNAGSGSNDADSVFRVQHLDLSTSERRLQRSKQFIRWTLAVISEVLKKKLS